jgi:hypothetical protein
MDEEDESRDGSPAQPETSAEPGTWPLRPVLAIAALIVVALIGIAGYSCIRSSGGRDSFSAPESRFPPGTVTYIAAGRFYLVRNDNGNFLALSEVEDSQADRIAGCLIRYRPDLSAGNQAGVFRDDCHGTQFDRQGVAIDGSAPAMQQHPVRVAGGTVTVRFRDCLAGGGSPDPEPCRE